MIVSNLCTMLLTKVVFRFSQFISLQSW